MKKISAPWWPAPVFSLFMIILLSSPQTYAGKDYKSLLSNFKSYKAQPKKKQEEVRRKREAYNKLPDEEKQKLREAYKKSHKRASSKK